MSPQDAQDAIAAQDEKTSAAAAAFAEEFHKSCALRRRVIKGAYAAVRGQGPEAASKRAFDAAGRFGVARYAKSVGRRMRALGLGELLKRGVAGGR